ncbi:MAG: hypothetical protein WBG50_23540 [Desulfomonilaceae bacterium]
MIRRIVVIALALSVSISVCALAADDLVKRLEDPCAGVSDLFQCVSPIEKEQMAKFPDKVSRRGGKLLIKLKNEKILTRVDSPEDWEGFYGPDGKLNASYRFYGFVNSWLVVLGRYWEAAGAEFINPDTGQVLSVDGWISFAPDRKHFFTRSHPGVSEPVDSIWGLSPAGIKQEWMFPGSSLLYDFAWSDPSTIEIRGDSNEVVARVRREGCTWKCTGPGKICGPESDNHKR